MEKRAPGRPRAEDREGDKSQGWHRRQTLKRRIIEGSLLSEDRLPNAADIENKRAELVTTGFPDFADLNEEAFRDKFKAMAEASLYFFNRYVMKFVDLAQLHIEVCDFLQDVSISRQKLLMIPVGCLKTSCGTHGMSLHALIQPMGRNCYFPKKDGANTRILIGCESEGQAKKNLKVIKEHLMQNRWLAWCWPKLLWADPKKDGAIWSDTQIQLRREAILREPTITAIGTDTAVFGDHYDLQMLDDIATLNAWQSPPLMERAKNWRKAVRSRVHDRRESIQIGIATYWGEVYDEWMADASVQVLVRSLIEANESIWPERFPMEEMEKLRAEDGDVLFAMQRMNKAVRSGFTALDWAQLREFRIIDTDKGKYVMFDESEADANLLEAKKARGSRSLSLLARGEPLSKVYGYLRRGGAGGDPDLRDHMKGKYGRDPYERLLNEE